MFQFAGLAGVKSRKKHIFEVTSAEFSVGQEESSSVLALELSISLESRIAVIGVEARAAVRGGLLDPQREGGHAVHDGVTHHEDLQVLHLCPSRTRQAAENTADAVDAEAVLASIASSQAQVIVLDEARDADCDEWAAIFSEVLLSNALRDFKGAVVVCVDRGSRALTRICSERWAMFDGHLRQRPRLEIVENALDKQADASALLKQACALKTSLSKSLQSWVDEARDEDWTITLFSGLGRAGAPELCGFLCHHLTDAGEFSIDFVFVPKDLRGLGYGKLLVQWAIERAAQRPQSECRWITLSAVEDKVVFYEKFGFTDLGERDVEGSFDEDGVQDRQIWMELRNVSNKMAECP